MTIDAKKLAKTMQRVFKLSGRRSPFQTDEQWQTFAWLVAGTYDEGPEAWEDVLDAVEQAAVGDVS